MKQRDASAYIKQIKMIIDRLKKSENYLAYHWEQSNGNLDYRRKVVNTATKFAKYKMDIINKLKKLVES